MRLPSTRAAGGVLKSTRMIFDNLVVEVVGIFLWSEEARSRNAFLQGHESRVDLPPY